MIERRFYLIVAAAPLYILGVSLFTTADLTQIGLPPHDPELRQWLTRLIGNQNYRRIGKSIRLYHF